MAGDEGGSKILICFPTSGRERRAGAGPRLFYFWTGLDAASAVVFSFDPKDDPNQNPLI